MKIYIYDEKTGEYLYEYSPQENPKKIGEYIFPPNSTKIVPPNYQENYVAIFENKNWILKKDFRSKQIINLDSKEISIQKEIGEIKDGFMLIEDYKSSDEYIQQQKIFEIETQKKYIESKIFEFDIKRIRAICEPSLKNEFQTWAQYYTNKIVELRKQLQEL